MAAIFAAPNLDFLEGSEEREVPAACASGAVTRSSSGCGSSLVFTSAPSGSWITTAIITAVPVNRLNGA
jgi:hypothetical protein